MIQFAWVCAGRIRRKDLGMHQAFMANQIRLFDLTYHVYADGEIKVAYTAGQAFVAGAS